MTFEGDLIPARLVRRYKRFLADVGLDTGEVVTAHCANPGAMQGLADRGLRVWLLHSRDPKRKLAYSWELVELAGLRADSPVLVGINTSHPNRLASEAIERGVVGELAGYESMRREVAYGRNSRIDLLLTDRLGRLCYVEVKNTHLMRQPGLAEFPDTRTERGAKHLHELSRMVGDGHRAVMLYVIQRSDADRFAIAADKDPAYASAFVSAQEAGVEMLAYACTLTLTAIEIAAPIKLLDKPQE